MNRNTDPKERSDKPESEIKKVEETRQQQTDPNLTELKGLTDPDEPLEVEGTDNPFDKDGLP